MKKILLYILIYYSLLIVDGFSQPQFEWVRNYPMRGQASAMDSTGNIYIVGTIGTVIHLLKYNVSGNLIWQRFDSLETDGMGICASADKFGNVYFTAEVYRVIPGQGYTWVIATVKYDSTGNRNWIKRYTAGYESRASSMAIDIAGNIYVAGRGSLTGKYNYLTIKYNPQGDTLWTSSYISPYIYGGCMASSVCVDLQCNVYVTGNSIEVPPNSDYVTVKYNSSGIQQWVAKYDGSDHLSDAANCLIVDKFGYSYVTGISYYYNDNLVRIVTIKYNPNGDSVWTRQFMPQYFNVHEYGKNILLDSSLNVYVTGKGTDSLNNSGFRTIKYNKYGNLIWSSLDTNFVDQAYYSIMDKYGNIYSTGSTSNIIYSNEINSSGDRIWGAHYPQSVSPSEHYSGIKLFIDNYNNLYLFGSSLDSSILIKYALLTGINHTSENISGSYKLFQNYPNPFNPVTKIKFTIKENGKWKTGNGSSQWVTLKVYNILGKEVATLVNEKLYAGDYEAKFDGKEFSSGIYFYALCINSNLIETKQMTMIK